MTIISSFAKRTTGMLINTSAQDLGFMCLLEEGHGAGEKHRMSNERGGWLSCWLSVVMLCSEAYDTFHDRKRREKLLRVMTTSFYS